MPDNTRICATQRPKEIQRLVWHEECSGGQLKFCQGQRRHGRQTSQRTSTYARTIFFKNTFSDAARLRTAAQTESFDEVLATRPCTRFDSCNGLCTNGRRTHLRQGNR